MATLENLAYGIMAGTAVALIPITHITFKFVRRFGTSQLEYAEEEIALSQVGRIGKRVGLWCGIYIGWVLALVTGIVLYSGYKQ